MMITSMVGSASSASSAGMISETAFAPWTMVLTTWKSTSGQRACDTDSTSRSAADPRPVIRPMRRGKKGSGRLRRASKSPSAARATRNRSMRASSSPMPTGRHCVAHRENDPRPA